MGEVSKKRVVVTGMGVVTPLGLNLSETWQALLEGRSGIGLITRFHTEGWAVRIAGEVKGFQADPLIPKKEQKKMDLFIQYALVAAHEALTQAGWLPQGLSEVADRVGVLLGVGIGGLPLIEQQKEVLQERGPDRISPFFIPAVISNLASGQVSLFWGLRGPNLTVSSACASGAHAIGEAVRWIQQGRCDVVIAGGTESAVTPLAIAGFDALKALSRRNHEPAQASCPFDRRRDGFVLSEGAAVLILESLDLAQKRSAPIWGEICGYGASSDAYHMTHPEPEARGAVAAMQAALQDARVSPESISWINAHGTSTPIGDKAETLAIKTVFGAQAFHIPVSSLKAQLGHTLGAAGAIETVLALKALQEQVILPTLTYQEPDPECDLDYVPREPRKVPIKYVLKNSFGFGGTNACLVLGRFT